MIKALFLHMVLLGIVSHAYAQVGDTIPDTLQHGVGIRFMYHPDHWQADSDSTRYIIEAGPDIWYNGYDGVKFGMQLHGGKANRHHVFNLFVWGNSGLGQWGLPKGTDRNGFMPLSFMADYGTSLSKYWKNSAVAISGRVLDGLYGFQLGATKANPKGTITYGLYFKGMYRPLENGTAYLLDRDHWRMDRWNNSINATFDLRYAYTSGKGEVNVLLRSSNLGSQSDYHYARVQALNHTEVWMVELHSRVFVQMGYGTDWAAESRLYLDKASPEEQMDSRFTRAAGIFPAQWAEYREVQNHFHAGGGLNLRGYAGYLAPEVTDDGLVLAYSGSNGVAVNLDLDFDRLLGSDKWPLRKWVQLQTYLFADAGIISVNATDAAPSFAMPRADAGLGLAFTVYQWGPIAKIRPLTIRFDMPFFVSRPAALQPEPWAFRWVLGIGRTF